jgi:hypothetical protein
MDEEPVIQHFCIAFDGGPTGGETQLFGDEVPPDEKLATIASATFLDMAQLADMDEKEFLKRVVNDYNSRKKWAMTKEVEPGE